MPETSAEVKKETRQEGVCQMLPVLFQKERKQPPRGGLTTRTSFQMGGGMDLVKYIITFTVCFLYH